MKLPRKRKASNLIGLGIFTPWVVIALLFYGLRRLEVWLHQHIFKVGWLVTNQYQTTTILYYAFFLPGILLNQITVWTVAGFLNVRAQHSLAWPQKQEIGELKLNFVQLSKTVDPFRLAIISTAPLIVGLIITWHIANNILNVQAFVLMVGQGGFLGNIANSVGKLTSAPDFWLWFYVAFTIGNTMIPKFENLRGWSIVLVFFIAAVIILYALGAGNQVIMDNLQGPVTNSLNALSSIFAIIIGLDIFMVAVLGTIEAIIERVTGNSATFEKGKMITMSRAEMLAQRAKALAVQPTTAKGSAVPSGPPSVYKLQFSIPSAPGKESVTRDEGIIITPDPNLKLPTSTPAALPLRSTPAIIPGTASEKLPPSTEPKPASVPSATPLRSHPAIISGSDEDKSSTSAPPRPPIPAGSSAVSTFNAPARPVIGSGSTPAQPRSTPGVTSSPTVPTAGSPPKPPFGSPATNPPAQPARPASGSAPPSGISPFRQPVPKPGSPAAKPSENINDEDSDDDITYEDFEDPA